MNNTVTKIKAHLKSTPRGRREAQAECTAVCDEYRYFPSIDTAMERQTELVSVTPVEAISYDAKAGTYISHEVLA